MRKNEKTISLNIHLLICENLFFREIPVRPRLLPQPIYFSGLSPIPLSINAECGNEGKF